MEDIVARLLSAKESDGLDSFDLQVRRESLEKYIAEIGGAFPDSPTKHNMHCHTFYSYNCFGWSPTHVALAAKLLGFRRAGMVDFDVLNGVDEFLSASKRLGLYAVCGMETRVFIREFADREINSPGEPGIAYHMGIGFRSGTVPEAAKAFAADLAARAGKRTATVVERVNAAVPEAALDYEKDVMSLTPAGNPTERHVCFAYRVKADSVFGSHGKALEYWRDALKLDAAKTAKAASSDAALEGFIRSALMKSGGPGYIAPDASSFPTLEAMNSFTSACGAVPCVAWLNGCSAGESDPVRLLEFHMSKGARVLTIIPDRNWNTPDPEKKAKLVANLDAVIRAARMLRLPVIAGTELNTPGQKLVDDFHSEPLALYLDDFLSGAERVCCEFN